MKNELMVLVAVALLGVATPRNAEAQCQGCANFGSGQICTTVEPDTRLWNSCVVEEGFCQLSGGLCSGGPSDEDLAALPVDRAVSSAGTYVAQSANRSIIVPLDIRENCGGQTIRPEASQSAPRIAVIKLD